MDGHNPPRTPRVNEVRSRGEAIRAMLHEASDVFSTQQPKDHGKGVILRTHSDQLFEVLREAYPRFQRQTDPKEDEPLIVDTFAIGDMRRDGLRRYKAIMDNESADFFHLLGLFISDATTPMTKGTFDAAYWAAQSAVEALELVFQEGSSPRVTYAVCRPPGHHASRDIAGGFCFFNNGLCVFPCRHNFTK